jgi:hypothetical protein
MLPPNQRLQPVKSVLHVQHKLVHVEPRLPLALKRSPGRQHFP